MVLFDQTFNFPFNKEGLLKKSYDRRVYRRQEPLLSFIAEIDEKKFGR